MSKIKKWKLLSEKNISPSKWFPLFQQKVQMPNGKVIDDYFVSKLGNVAMVVPITSEGDIIFVKQYKQGVGEITLELPSGRVDKGEDEMNAAKRELKEEIGGVAKNWEYLGEVYPASSKDSTKVFGFLARNVEMMNKQKLDETEDIEIINVPIKELSTMIANNEIRHSDGIALLMIVREKYPELF